MSGSYRCGGCSRGIGAGEIRELIVFNKIDLMGAEARARAETMAGRRARASMGLGRKRRGTWRVARGDGQAVRPESDAAHAASASCPRPPLRSDLYRRDAVRAERQCEDGSWEIDVELDPAEIAKVLGGRGVEPGAARERPRSSLSLRGCLAALVAGVGC